MYEPKFFYKSAGSKTFSTLITRHDFSKDQKDDSAETSSFQNIHKKEESEFTRQVSQGVQGNQGISHSNIEFVENDLSTKYLESSQNFSSDGLNIPPPPKSSKWLWWLIGSTCLLVAGLVGYIFFSGQKPITHEEVVSNNKPSEPEAKIIEESNLTGFNKAELHNDENKTLISKIIPEKKITDHLPPPVESKIENPGLPVNKPIPSVHTFSIPQDWKNAEIEILKPLANAPEDYTRIYFWNGEEFTLDEKKIEDQKNLVFWVDEKKESGFSKNFSKVSFF